VGVLVLLAVTGWAAAFGPLREQAQALLKAAPEEPQVDLGPRPIDPTTASRSEKPRWLLEKEEEQRRLAEEKRRQRAIEEAANDPELQKSLLELDAQLSQIYRMEAEQRRLRIEAKEGRAAGEANSRRIEDLQKQIDELKRVTGARGGDKRGIEDGEPVQIVRDEKSARSASLGFLTLRTYNPQSAAVFAGDTPLGTTPLVKVALEAGTHKLRVVDGESKDRVLSVRIEAGRVNEFRAIDVTSLPLSP
jgi:serine/threonine-protein kinase